MSNGDPEQASSAAEQERRQLEALYGPSGRGDYQRGETITFASRDTGGRALTGEILYVRAPAPAVRGGQIHSITYITFVENETFPRIVYPADIEHKNSSS